MSETTTRPSLMRRLLFILLLFVVCAAINWLYIAAASWRGVLTGDAGDLLYIATFDGFNDDWREYQGRESATIDSSVLNLAIDSTESTVYSPAAPYFDDFDVQVTARATGGVENGGFGIIFRLQEPRTACRLPLQVMCDLAETNNQVASWANLLIGADEEATGFMMFLIDSEGWYSVWRGTDDGTSKISTWIQSDALNTGFDVDNNLRVIARDNRYQFFINDLQVELCIPDDPTAISTYSGGECIGGSMLATLVDDSFDIGQIALVVDTVGTFDASASLSVQFDNVIVTVPQATGEGA